MWWYDIASTGSVLLEEMQGNKQDWSSRHGSLTGKQAWWQACIPRSGHGLHSRFKSAMLPLRSGWCPSSSFGATLFFCVHYLAAVIKLAKYSLCRWFILLIEKILALLKHVLMSSVVYLHPTKHLPGCSWRLKGLASLCDWVAVRNVGQQKWQMLSITGRQQQVWQVKTWHQGWQKDG